MKKIALALAMTALLGYAGACVYLYFAQRSMLYFPTPETASNEAAVIRVQSGRALLKVWVVQRSGPGAAIYFGGNADEVASHIGAFSEAISDRTLYFVNYRGFGGSTGKPKERALFADALAVFDQVQRDHPHVAVIGRSLGSGVAAYLATQRRVEKLILVTPYDSIERVAQNQYRWFPIFLLLKDRFDTLSRVPKISAPTLVVIAENDEVIPRARTDALVRAFPANQVRVKVLKGVTHNLEDGARTYLDALRAFLAN